MASNPLQTIAAAAWALKRASTQAFHSVMHQTVRNAQALAQALMQRDFGVLTGGTDCHMLMADLRPLYKKYPDGPKDANEYCDRLERIGVSVNSKKLPFDPSGKANGLRMGCTILAQRGMKEDDMQDIADIFMRTFAGDADSLDQCRRMVGDICTRFTADTLYAE